MSRSFSVKLAAASGGAAVAIAAAGALSAAHAGGQPRAAAATDVVVSTQAQTPLSTTHDKTTVLTQHLRAGSYVVSATASLVNFGASDYTRCQITLGDTQLTAVTALVGDGTATGNHGDGAIVMPMPLQSGVVVPAGGDVLSLRCWHDHDGVSEYVDGGPVLAAHRSDSLRLVTR